MESRPPGISTWSGLRQIRESNGLLICGTALFFFGLLNGALLPLFPNHRQGLSAHLAGVQDGMVLWIVGLMWHRVALGATLRRIVSMATIYSMYAIWAGLVLAAFRSGDAAPSASPRPILDAAVGALELSGSLAILGACLGVLVGLVRGGKEMAHERPVARSGNV